MPTVRIASANIEWMNNWFSGNTGPAAWLNTKMQTAAGRAAAMIQAIDPDVVGVQEAPSRPEEMDLFIRDFLTAGGQPIYQYLLGDSGGAQKLAVLYKPA